MRVSLGCSFGWARAFGIVAAFAAVCAVTMPVVAESRLETAQAGFGAAGGSAEGDRCAELLKECFAYGAIEKSSCFNVSANHPFCAETELGRLAAKRFAMSPQHDGRATGPALTGPQLVDGDCVANFDSQWSGYLIGGNTSREAVRQLDAVLDGCAKAVTNEIFRP